MKKIFLWLFLTLTIVSCSDNDETNGMSSLNGWYADLEQFAQESDFDEINEAIRNEEVLYKTKYNTYIATRDLFFSENGMWHDTNWEVGRFRFYLWDQGKFQVPIIHIINNNTLALYYANLYDANSSMEREDDENLYKFYAGPIFKEMVYRDFAKLYTYSKVDNKIIVTNGDIFTITEKGLIQEGSSSSNIMSKFDPNKLY